MSFVHFWKKTQKIFLVYRYKEPTQIIGKVDRIKKLSMEILEVYKEKFGTDFLENKKILDTISIVRSKELKNELAGFITKCIKREIREKEAKEAQLEKESKMISEEESTQSQKIQTTSETSSDSPITENPEQELPKETSD